VVRFAAVVLTLTVLIGLGREPAPHAERQASVAERPAPARFEHIVLGASLFRAAWAYRHDRAWLDDQLSFLQRHRFTAIRALGVVGDPSEPDYWDGREIDWRWPDYDAVIAGLTDLAFDSYGIRVQWTIFADADANIPDPADRGRLIERFIRMSRGRERKILAFEVANEYAQNGFSGPEGLAALGGLAARLNEATPVPVAASAHDAALCALYESQAVDLATFHFNRARDPGRPWAPFLEPWRLSPPRLRRDLTGCGTLPPLASNNEPIGPGVSGESETDPLRLVSGAAISYVSGLPIYIFHSGPGVRDDTVHPNGLRPSRLQDLPRATELFGGFAALMRSLPPDVHTWPRVALGDARHPFADVGGEMAGMMAAVNDGRFVVIAAGLRDRATLVARYAIRVDAINPLTGAIQQRRDLEPGQPLDLDKVEAFILIGDRQ
jgi:hypothetical protein